VALVPEGTTVSVTSITVTPDRVTLRVGQMQSFTATLTGENVAGLAPTWVVDGGIGRISPHGMFMAERPGAGRVRALANGAEGSATVTVTGG
jgi:uncharacterized protein YjdB